MRKRGESGFALLLVFLMAALIAISLYMEMPRVAFQAQRQKEQLLIERGEQYKRAIQLFVKATGRYPGDLKDLENFNHRRFLRHRFIDPMTGSADWRLVHINGGMLTDSVVTKPKPVDPNQPGSSTAGQYVSEIPSLGTPTAGQPMINSAVGRRRMSEGGAPPLVVGPDGQPIAPDQPASPGAVPFPGFPGAPPPPGALPSPAAPSLPGFPPLPNQAFPGGATPPNPGVPFPPGTTNLPGAGNVFGQPVPGQPLSDQPLSGRMPGFPSTQTPGGQPAPNPGSQAYVGSSQPYVGSSQPYVGGGVYIGSQPTSTAGVNPPSGIPGPGNPFPPPVQPGVPNNPGVPGTPGVTGLPGLPQEPQSPDSSGASQTAPPLPQPGTGGPNPAAGMINNLLTNPRQPSVSAPAGGQPLGGQQFGGGIAGVASKSENPSIMIYNDRTQYNEWEFIFDITKQRPVQNPFGSPIGTPAANLGPGFGSPGFGAPAAAGPAAAPAVPGGFGLGLGGLASAPSGQSPASGTSPFGANRAPATGMTAVGMQANGLPLGFRMGRP